MELFIFDRWGEELFVTNDPDRGWDGVYKGKLSKNDVYVYELKFTTLGGKKTYQNRTRDFNEITNSMSFIKKESFFLLLFLFQLSKAQLPVGRDTLLVIENSNTSKLAWAGGLNSCMFSQIDLNDDGKKDLVAFDKVNNFAYGIFRCFINNGGAGEIKYAYTHQYNSALPPVQQWAYFYDYNNDGRADLFTYNLGGIKVFKNTSTASALSFTLAKNYLLQTPLQAQVLPMQIFIRVPFLYPDFRYR